MDSEQGDPEPPRSIPTYILETITLAKYLRVTRTCHSGPIDDLNGRLSVVGYRCRLNVNFLYKKKKLFITECQYETDGFPP